MFSSKSQISTGNYNCVDIAGHMYLWTPAVTLGTPRRLIISAHGLRRTTYSFQIQQNTTLNFYSADKYSVIDPILGRFYEKKHRAAPVDTLKRGDRCYNYILTKYTNSERNKSHNKKGETYNSIQDLMHRDFEGEAMDLNAHVHKIPAGMPNLTKDVMGRIADYNRVATACVLTIRYRRFRTFVNLKWALKALEKRGYIFEQVDCLFCRNNLWTGMLGRLGYNYSQTVQYR